MYQETIKKIATEQGRPDVDPRHIEAYMRLEHRTLDGLSRRQFTDEVELCIMCVDEVGTERAENCAASFNL